MLGLAIALSSLVLRRLVVLTRKFKGCEGLQQIGCPNSQRCPSLMVSSKAEAMRLQLVIRPACPCGAIHENTLPSTHAMPALAAFERTCSVALAGAGIISLAIAMTSLMQASAISMHYDMCGCSVFAAAVAYSKAQAGAGGISATLSKVARWCCQPFCGLL